MKCLLQVHIPGQKYCTQILYSIQKCQEGDTMLPWKNPNFQLMTFGCLSQKLSSLHDPIQKEKKKCIIVLKNRVFFLPCKLIVFVPRKFLPWNFKHIRLYFELLILISNYVISQMKPLATRKTSSSKSSTWQGITTSSNQFTCRFAVNQRNPFELINHLHCIPKGFHHFSILNYIKVEMSRSLKSADSRFD